MVGAVAELFGHGAAEELTLLLEAFNGTGLAGLGHVET
jgi:hypothetical protein